ncbi:HEAT repeat domain-containing protein [Verrucomicrobia bacterium S94]|nr:HEAT repeat domain-containing protein [Verrucomicrobia bacterium S94]
MKKIILVVAVIGVFGLVYVLSRSPVTQADQPESQINMSAIEVSRPQHAQEVPMAESEIESGLSENHPVFTVVDPKSGYQTRLEAMRKLGQEMSTNDIAVLMDFLNEPMPEDAKLGNLFYNSIRNDAYEILLRQKELPDGMGELLVNGYNNPNQDDTWRNYCIQFMQPFYERQSEVLSFESETGSREALVSSTADSEAAVPPQELQIIQDTLWDALGERDNSNAGAALLALDKLSRDHDEFDKGDINAAMLNLAQDEQASLANRVTAIRLCGERKNIHVLETARDLAHNSDITILRCAAIATLGEIGSEEDIALLESLSVSRDKRISKIASTSLSKRSLVE